MGGHNSLRGTIFTSEYCPGGHYSRGDTFHSDTGFEWQRAALEQLLRALTDRQTHRQTYRQTDYCNPAAHAQRVNTIARFLKFTQNYVLSVYIVDMNTVLSSMQLWANSPFDDLYQSHK